ncbi:MAG: hypothetical protein AAGL18_00235 [Pseudomonadota bacterium]
MRSFILFVGALGALLSAPAAAHEPAIDFRGVDEALTTKPTKVMVAGSTHLGGNEAVTAETLTPLIDRLATFADWPDEPSGRARRKLASAFLAAGEPYSALVQWWRLPEKERKAGDGLGPASIKALERYASSMNENSSIAARLAAQLGLERVYAADDHSSDLVLADHGEAL